MGHLAGSVGESIQSGSAWHLPGDPGNPSADRSSWCSVAACNDHIQPTKQTVVPGLTQYYLDSPKYLRKWDMTP